jgi:hypothetical protein
MVKTWDFVDVNKLFLLGPLPVAKRGAWGRNNEIFRLL